MIFSTRVGDVRGIFATKTDEAGLAESLGVFCAGESGIICEGSPELYSGEPLDLAEFETDLDTSEPEDSIIWLVFPAADPVESS